MLLRWHDSQYNSGLDHNRRAVDYTNFVRGFMDDLHKEAHRCKGVISTHFKMTARWKLMAIFGVNLKVTDHCHITGEFRGAAQNICSLTYFKGDILNVLVIVYYPRGYDSHQIIEVIGEYINNYNDQRSEVNVILINIETYLMIEYKNVVFIDSCKILSAPLANLLEKAKASELRLMSELCNRKGWTIDVLMR